MGINGPTMALRSLNLTILGIGLVLFSAPFGMAWSGPEAGNPAKDAVMAPKTIADVLHENVEGLMAIPGVVGVAQGLTDGRSCIMVYVIEFTPELSQEIPTDLGGYPVVVEVTGEIRVLPKKRRDRSNH